MFNLFSSTAHQQIALENFAKSHQQLAEEQNEQAARFSARLSLPGYSRVMIQNPDGSCSIRSIYTEDYLQYTQSDRAWALYKALYLLLAVASVTASFLAMLAPSALNVVSYVGLLEGCCLLSLAYFLYALAWQVFSPRRMELRHHKAALKHFRRAAPLYTLCLTALSAVMVIHTLANGLSPAAPDIFCMAGTLLAALLVFLIFGLEAARKHTVVPNKLPDNMEIID